MTPTSLALPRKRLPIGIQTLREIREDDLIGVEFSKASCNVVGFEVETLSF